MSISFSMIARPHESHGAVLDPQILSCSTSPLRRSRASAGVLPACTISPQNRHIIKRSGQVDDWCSIWKKEPISTLLSNMHLKILVQIMHLRTELKDPRLENIAQYQIIQSCCFHWYRGKEKHSCRWPHTQVPIPKVGLKNQGSQSTTAKILDSFF